MVRLSKNNFSLFQISVAECDIFELEIRVCNERNDWNIIHERCWEWCIEWYADITGGY